MKKHLTALLTAATITTAALSSSRLSPNSNLSIQQNHPKSNTAMAIQTNACGLPLQKDMLQKQKKQPRMLVYKNRLYIDTGEISTAGRCGVMDGKITKTVAAGKIPKKELQSNFGKGYSFQLGTRSRRLEVLIDDTWHIFACNENNLDGVTMKVKSYTATSAILSIQNTGDKSVLFGEEFLLEKKIAGTKEWRAVPYSQTADVAFNSIGLLADKDSLVKWRADWKTIYGALKPGTYRIVKEFRELETEGANEAYTLSAKFRIEDSKR